jgi:CheY-like chemotaxis protein
MILKEEKNFLLADDDSDDREMFCEALLSIESTVICHTAVDSREALHMLDELAMQPHLIFLDVNMPVMSGWQCLKFLKEHHDTKRYL